MGMHSEGDVMHSPFPLFVWFEHIFYFISHIKGLGRAKMLCHSPLPSCLFVCLLKLTTKRQHFSNKTSAPSLCVAILRICVVNIFHTCLV